MIDEEKELFLDTKTFGKLYTNQVFLYSYVPIIFTSIDEKSNHYFCLNHIHLSEDSECLWAVIGKLNNIQYMLDYLNDKITIYDILLNCEKVIQIRLYNNYNEEIVNPIKFNWLSDANLDPEPNEFDEEIEYFKQILEERSDVKRIYK